MASPARVKFCCPAVCQCACLHWLQQNRLTDLHGSAGAGWVMSFKGLRSGRRGTQKLIQMITSSLVLPSAFFSLRLGCCNFGNPELIACCKSSCQWHKSRLKKRSKDCFPSSLQSLTIQSSSGRGGFTFLALHSSDKVQFLYCIVFKTSRPVCPRPKTD